MTKQEEALIVLNKYANDYLTAKEDYPAFEYAIECVRERKVGKWEWYKESPTYMRCSSCGEAEFRKTKYCPHCGAKMEGAENDRV